MKSAFRGMKGPVYLTANLRLGNGGLSFARAGVVNQAVATGTIVVYTFTETAGTLALADIASDADNWIDVYVIFQKTPVADGFNVHNT
jgi:hypothetical protein